MVFMDELAQARIELEQLNKLEQDLEEELSAVRVAIKSYASRIEHLAWAKAPINSLPYETLSYVIELVASSTFYHRTLSDLARVSRAWRSVILDSPKFWSRIDLNPRARMSLVKASLERSCSSPLQIAIGSWHVDAPGLSTLVDAVVPHVHRWRTLEIRGSRQCLRLVLKKVGHLKFPSLASATINSDISIEYPSFLGPENSPSLTTLNFSNLDATDEFPLGQRITDLSILFSSRPFGPLTLPSLLSSQHLTTLKLVYSACPLLQPNSISLPSLTSLTLGAQYPRGLISAIVVPRLSYFHFMIIPPENQLCIAFRGSESKFRGVQRLRLHVQDDTISTVECAEPISSVFPNVRHVELSIAEAEDFFRRNQDGSCPADHWKSLESLTFHDMPFCCETDHFVHWVREWNLKGLPMLYVNFILCQFSSRDNDTRFSSPSTLSRLHDSLREICILYMEGVFLNARFTTRICLTSAPPPPLVRTLLGNW